MYKHQPKYMYQLIHIGFLLNEIITHYSYDNNNDNKCWLWCIRQQWFNIIIYLISNNVIIEKNKNKNNNNKYIMHHHYNISIYY